VRSGVQAGSAAEAPEPAQGTSRRRVVVVGSSNQDVVVTMSRLPSPGQTVIADSITLMSGGKGANQAVAAARAGADVSFVSAIGDDDAGRRTIESLRAEGIDSSAVETYPGQPTGTAVVLVSNDGENQIAIVQGANAALSPDHVRRSLTDLQIGPGDVVLVSFEIEDDAVTAAAECAHELGALLLVNPAPARPLNAQIVKAQPVLLPNRSEAEAISGVAGDDGARRLHELTGAPVIVTLGGDGVLIVDDDGERRLPAESVDVVDTTGAGDTFAGVLAAQLASGAGMEAAVQHAVVAGALSVTKAGAREGSPTAAQITARLRERGVTTTGG
jgi:ribokinase